MLKKYTSTAFSAPSSWNRYSTIYLGSALGTSMAYPYFVQAFYQQAGLASTGVSPLLRSTIAHPHKAKVAGAMIFGTFGMGQVSTLYVKHEYHPESPTANYLATFAYGTAYSMATTPLYVWIRDGQTTDNPTQFYSLKTAFSKEFSPTYNAMPLTQLVRMRARDYTLNGTRSAGKFMLSVGLSDWLDTKFPTENPLLYYFKKVCAGSIASLAMNPLEVVFNVHIKHDRTHTLRETIQDIYHIHGRSWRAFFVGNKASVIASAINLSILNIANAVASSD